MGWLFYFSAEKGKLIFGRPLIIPLCVFESTASGCWYCVFILPRKQDLPCLVVDLGAAVISKE